MQGGGFHPWNPVDFTLKSGGFHLWNLAEFTQISSMKSTQNYKSKCFSKNSSVWWMQGGGYDQRFHEIHQISPWNLADLTCEIQWISPRYHLWNPPKIIKASVSVKTLQFDECRVGDFTLKSGGFHLWNLADFTQISPVKSTQNYKSKCFSKNSSVWWMQGGGYDQGFHEIHQISPWNLVDFTCEIQQSSPRFHLWNPPKIIKASVSAKTLQFDECKVGAMTKDFMKSATFHMKSAWNLLDFMWNPPDVKIMSFCMMIKYRSFVFRKTNQKSFCWNIWFYKVWGGFHLKSAGFHADFMKSGGFHVKSKDLLQGIVTLCFILLA